MTRAEKVKRAQELYAQGLSGIKIAKRLGVARSTAYGYLEDPDLSKQRDRRRCYSVPCELCGSRTDGSGGYKVQRHVCMGCIRWSDEEIIASIQSWADAHGGIPPTVDEWRQSSPDHLSSSRIQRRIGWNNALLRAGYGLKCDRRVETQEWVERQLRAGVSTREIADALGVTPNAIRERMKYRGMRVSELRKAAA